MCKAAKREAMTLALIDYNFNLTPDIRILFAWTNIAFLLYTIQMKTII